MPEIQWICLCLFCTCNVYSFAFGILSNRWSSKSPHFAWHSSTQAGGAHIESAQCSSLPFTRPQPIYSIKPHIPQDFPHCLSCECKRSPKLIRPGRKAVFISETSLVTVALRSVCFRDVALVFHFCQLKYWVMSEIRDRFVIFSSGTHCNEPHVQSDLSNNTEQNS